MIEKIPQNPLAPERGRGLPFPTSGERVSHYFDCSHCLPVDRGDEPFM
ncbi:MAG: hypothetical protein ACXU9G_08145 [Syntrophales bacterium]